MIEIDKVVSSIRNGDEKGLKTLYHHYSGSLYGIVNRILIREEESEEALQECFLKIWNNIDSYQSTKATLYTWMATIARNTALDKRRLKSYEHFNQTESIVTGQNDPNVEPNISNVNIPDLLNRIPEKYRLLVDKMFLCGYTQQEISDELQMPLGTVKTRLREAISLLRDELKNEKHLLYIFSIA